MCGGFILGMGGHRFRHHLIGFQMGRLVTYATLGVALGLFGLSIKAMLPVWGPRLAQGLAGLVMVALAAGLLKPGKGLLPAGWVATSGRCLLAEQKPQASLLLGGLAGFLPCGLLYAAFGLALATQSPVLGGLAMVSFWAGTAPALVALGLLKDRLPGAARERLASAVTLAIGLATLYRAAFPAVPSCCH